MKFTMLSKRVAATGAVTALAAGVLVGATATSAQAATANGSYDCSVPGIGPLGTFPMVLDAPGLEEFPSVPAGFLVPPGFLSANSTLSAPLAAAGALTSLGVVGGQIDDFAIHIGESAAPAPLAVTSIVPSATGADVSASGVNNAFAMPAAGNHAILLPETFTFVPANAGGPIAGITVVCVTDAPASLGEIETTLNDSAISAKGPSKAIRKTARATIKSTVTGGFSAATGDVVAMKGKKTVGQGVLAEDGTAKFKLDRLKPGTHDIVVKYLGDGFRKASQDKVTVKVKR